MVGLLSSYLEFIFERVFTLCLTGYKILKVVLDGIILENFEELEIKPETKIFRESTVYSLGEVTQRVIDSRRLPRSN